MRADTTVGTDTSPSLSPDAVSRVPGRSWCEAWTATVDAAVQAGLARAQPGRSHGMAAVALGSYARRMLCPASDVDLLVLHDGWSDPDLEVVVRAVCYPLWDAGLVVGHAVRTPTEAVEAAADRLDIATTLADRRLVAGDPGLFDAFSSRARRWLDGRIEPLVDELAAGAEDRRGNAARRAGAREPNLKDGCGGLRDVQALRWAAACLLGETGLDPLVSAGYLGTSERRTLARAEDALLAARCALHLGRPRGRRRPSRETDVLRVDATDEVADRLGRDPADLSRELALATRAVAHLSDRVWPDVVRSARDGRRRTRGRVGARQEIHDGVVLADGVVEADGDLDLARRPSWGWELIAAAAERGTHLGRATADQLGRTLADDEAPSWDDGGRRAFLATLRAGRVALPALTDADQTGLFAASLPEWAAARGRPQRDPVHSYDLDTHSTETVACLVELGAGLLGERQATLWRELEHRDDLLVAALLHDLGKAWPGDHSSVGADLSGDVVVRMGFGAEPAQRVATLVRHHLLLPSVAVGRDLDDPAVIGEVAAAVGSRETLDALFLLALADGRATGPHVHSTWRHQLLTRLHEQARGMLTEVSPATAG